MLPLVFNFGIKISVVKIKRTFLKAKWKRALASFLIISLVASSMLLFRNPQSANADYVNNVNQGSWSGGADTVSTVTTETKDGWNKYYEKDAEIAAGEDISLSAQTVEGTANIDFTTEANYIQEDSNYTDFLAGLIQLESGSIAEQQKITASDSQADDNFGYSVAIDGDTAIVGAYKEDPSGISGAGSVYIFTRSGEVWTQQQKITASDFQADDNFGSSVAIDGDTAIVGVHKEDPSDLSNAGSAYIFTRSDTTWTQQQKINASDKEATDYFGSSVAIDGDTVAVGASHEDPSELSDAGSTYIFIRSEGVWTQQQKINADDFQTGDWFGSSVAISGETIIVGAHGEDPSDLSTAGSAYIFTRSDTTWTQQQKINASDKEATDYFGYSVAIDGDMAIVGVISEDPSSLANAGSAYIFSRSDTVWTEEKKITASDKAEYDAFGRSVDISGVTTIAGAYTEDPSSLNSAGSAYIFASDYPTISSYVTTSATSQIDTSSWSAMNSTTLTQTTPTNTDIKYLTSFDNRSTWKYWDGSAWQTSDLASIETNGNSNTVLEGLSTANWESAGGFTSGTLDFAVSLSTTDTAVTPSLDQISVNYSYTPTSTSSIDFTTEADYIQEDISTDTTLTPSATTGDVTLTLGSGNWSDITKAEVGTKVIGNGGVATISEAPTASTSIQASVDISFTDTSSIASGGWQLVGTKIDGSLKLNEVSTTDMTAWNQIDVDTGANHQYIDSIIYDSTNNKYVAAGRDDNGTDYDATVWESPDLTTWTQRDVDTAADRQGINSIIYDSVNNKYVAAGYSDNGTDLDAIVWESTDLITWTKRDVGTGADSQNILSIIYDSVNNKYAVAGYSYNGTYYDAIVWESTDLISWTQRYVDPDIINKYINSIIYDSTNNKYVAAGYSRDGAANDDAIVWESTDLVTWTQRDVEGGADTQRIESIIYDSVNSKYVAAGYDDNGTDEDAIVWESTDLTTWTRRNVDTGTNKQEIYSIIYDSVNNKYVTAGFDKNGTDVNATIWESTDLVTWTQRDVDTGANSQRIYSIIYDSVNSKYVSAGYINNEDNDATVWSLSLASEYPTSPHYTTTSATSQIDTSSWSAMNSTTLTQTTPANTDIKYLASFDNRSTWKYWDGSAWQTSTLDNIETNGNSNTVLEGLSTANWESAGGFTPGTLDFAISLSTTDSSVTPSLESIVISHGTTQTKSLTSSKFDTESIKTSIGGLTWDEDPTLPASSEVSIALRTASSEGNLDSATWETIGTSTPSSLTTGCTKSGTTVTCDSTTIPNGMKTGGDDRWFQYKVSITSGGVSPTVTNINPIYEQDTVAPTITSITSTTANGEYGEGDDIDITLNFSEDVVSSTGLTVTLNTGGTFDIPAWSTAVSNVTGTYTVGAGEEVADLSVTGVTGDITDQPANSLALDNASIDFADAGDYVQENISDTEIILGQVKLRSQQFVEDNKLLASDVEASDNFGYSVSISGDTAIVGAYNEDTGASNAGAAYIFTRSGSTWTEEQKIQASDKESDDNFGHSVSISGDTAIVGAYNEDTGASNAGAAYIFTRSGSTWTEEQKIQASDKETDDLFGRSVSISMDTVVVGAYLEDTGGESAGAAYIFTRSGTTWTEEQKIQSSDIEAYDSFGYSVSISGDTAIIGAYKEDTGASNAGSAYIFTRSGSTWTEEQKIQSSDIEESDSFGYSVAVSIESAIAGAYFEATGGSAAGAAYIFSSSYSNTSSYITTSATSQIDTSSWSSMSSATLTQTTPANTSIKYLTSFDNRSTWKYWDGSAWQTSTLDNIETNGNSNTVLEGLSTANWESTGGFTPGTLDFAISLSTTDSSVTPSLDSIVVNFTAPDDTYANTTTNPDHTTSNLATNSILLDATAPTSTVTIPDGVTLEYTQIDTLTGTASDDNTLDKTEITIQNTDSGLYWTGTAWGDQTWLTTTGTTSWEYDSSNVTWIVDENFTVRSRAIDQAGNIETPSAGNSFIFINSPPTITINSTQKTASEVVVDYDVDDIESAATNVSLAYDSNGTLVNSLDNSSTASIEISDTSNFPASGTILLKYGTGTSTRYENITYTSVNGNYLEGITRGTDSTIAYSHDAGETVRIKANTLSGDVGSVANGTDKTITWNATSDTSFNNATQTVTVVSNDGASANKIGVGTSGTFDFDTTTPTINSANINALSDPAQLTFDVTDNDSIEMMISLESDFTGASWEAYTSDPTISLDTDPDTVYVKFRDQQENITATQELTTPQSPQSLMIQDVSSTEQNKWRLYTSWQIISEPTAGFKAYRIYRSTSQGGTYVYQGSTAEGDINVDYYADNVNEDDTYYYKIASEDLDGNISNYSTYVWGTANGTQDAGEGGGGSSGDSTAPTINTGPTVESTTASSATISFNTDESSDSFIEYGTTTSYGNVYGTPDLTTAHSVALPDSLSGSETYHFRVRTRDAAGNLTISSDYTFDTQEGADETPPVITDVLTSSLAPTSVTITWTTDEGSNSLVDFGTTQNTYTTTQGNSDEETTNHEVTLTGLSPATPYYFRVKSEDTLGNQGEDDNSGNDYTFTTDASPNPGDVTPPTISSVSTSNLTSSSVTITWSTNEDADSVVGYSEDTSYTQEQGSIALTQSHSINLSGLSPETTYYFQVKSRDNAGNLQTETDDQVYTFTTNTSGSGDGPVISDVFVSDLSYNSATINWDTAAEGNSLVDYGVSSSFGESYGNSNEEVLDHSVKIPGLSSLTTYYFQVKTKNNSGNEQVVSTDDQSQPLTFTTLSGSLDSDDDGEGDQLKDISEDLEGLVDDYEYSEEDVQGALAKVFTITSEGPSVEITNNTTATVTWDTSKGSNGKVVYWEDGSSEDTAATASEVGNTNKEHEVIIKNLNAQTTYNYYTKSATPLGGEVESSAKTFETGDTPSISGINVTDITLDSAVVSWIASASSLKVEYGTSSKYGSEIDAGVGEDESTHAAKLEELSSGETYHFRIKGVDDDDETVTSDDYSFTTSELPEISNVTTTETTTETVTITWNTNTKTDSKVNYKVQGETEGASQGKLEAVNEHEVVIEDLIPGTTYEYTVSSKDQFANSSNSESQYFTTQDDSNPPKIRSVKQEATVFPNKESKIQTIVSWNTDKAANSVIAYKEGKINGDEGIEEKMLDNNTTEFNGWKIVRKEDNSLNHMFVFTDFNPSSVYYFKVANIDKRGNVATSDNYSVMTPAKKKSIFDLIISNFEDTFGWVKQVGR